MNKYLRIGIIGGYGWKNIGDDIQLYNNVRVLKERGYNNLFIFSPHDYIAKLCKVDKVYPSFHNVLKLKDREKIPLLIDRALMIYYKTLNYGKRRVSLSPEEKKFIDVINNIDVLFVSGSGTINTRTLYGLLITIIPCIIAQNLGKKVVLSGQGMLPLNNFVWESLISYTLNKCEKIFIRDFELGKKGLQRINVQMSKIILGIDDAFTTIPKKNEKFKIAPNTVTINVSQFLKPEKYGTFHSLAKRLKKAGYNPLFNYFQTDKKVAEACSKGKFPIYECGHFAEMVGLYYDVVGSIGMRYHSAIFGLAGNHPVVNIYISEYQKGKVRAIRESTKLPYFMIDMKNCTSKSLFDMFEKAMKAQPKVLEEINKEWRKRANLAVKYLDKL